jgi:hypothetical protein
MFAKIGPRMNLNVRFPVTGSSSRISVPAAELEIEDRRQGRDEERLRQPRNTHQEAMPVREEHGQELLHDGVLADDDLAKLGQYLPAGALQFFE